MSDTRRRLAELEQRTVQAAPCLACRDGHGVHVTFPDDLRPVAPPRCAECGRGLVHIVVSYEDMMQRELL